MARYSCEAQISKPGPDQKVTVRYLAIPGRYPLSDLQECKNRESAEKAVKRNAERWGCSFVIVDVD